MALRSHKTNGSLQAVIGPTAKGEQQEFSSKYLLEKACLDEAGRCFSQANDTPLLQQPILQWFGETGTSKPAFKRVLQGKFNQEIENPYMVKLLHNLKKPENVPEFEPRSLEDYTSGWRKA